MAIDFKSRKRYFDELKNKLLIKEVGKVAQNTANPPSNDEIVKPLTKVEELNNNSVALTLFVIAHLENISTAISEMAKLLPSTEDTKKIQDAIEAIKFPEFPGEIKTTSEQGGQILEAIREIKFPPIPETVTVKSLESVIDELKKIKDGLKFLKPIEKAITKVEGKVEVTNLVKPEKLDLKPLVASFSELRKDILSLKPGNPKEANLSPLLSALHEIRDGIDALLEKEEPSSQKVEVVNFPPQKYPQPVTNININGLQGFAKCTSDTVTTSRTALPSYGQLFNRRSLIVFNNSTDTTLYLGGSDVTSSNGLPVLAQSYSPAIDAGYGLVVYGIVASGSCNVRTFEVSKDKSDTIQQ